MQRRRHAGDLVAVLVDAGHQRRHHLPDGRRQPGDHAGDVPVVEVIAKVIVEDVIDLRHSDARDLRERRRDRRRRRQLPVRERRIPARRRRRPFHDPLDQCRDQRTVRVGHRVRILRERAALVGGLRDLKAAGSSAMVWFPACSSGGRCREARCRVSHRYRRDPATCEVPRTPWRRTPRSPSDTSACGVHRSRRLAALRRRSASLYVPHQSAGSLPGS